MGTLPEIKTDDDADDNFAEVHQFPRNSVMEFSEYLQLDRMAHWPRFLRHPVYHAITLGAVFDKLFDSILLAILWTLIGIHHIHGLALKRNTLLLSYFGASYFVWLFALMDILLNAFINSYVHYFSERGTINPWIEAPGF